MKQYVIEHAPVGFFSLKIDRSGEITEIKDSHGLWSALEQNGSNQANQIPYFTSVLRQSIKKSIPAFMIGLRSKHHDVISGYFTFGLVQKFLKFDFFSGEIIGPLHHVLGSVSYLTDISIVSRHYEEVLEASQAYTWNFDLLKNEATFGPSFSQHSKYGPGTLTISMPEWSSILHPDDFVQATEALSDLRTGKRRRVVVQYRRRDKLGNWISLRVHAGVSRYDFDGKPIEIKGISFNITPQREGC